MSGEGLFFDLRHTRPGFTLTAEAEVPKAGITALFGPSGSGKTTLLRAIAGLEREVSGQVTLDGVRWHDGQRGLIPPHRRRIGMVGQHPVLFPHLDVAGNIAYAAERSQIAKAQQERIIELMDVGPLLTRAVSSLSGGERQRVALARAMACDPALLLFDEPLSALDGRRKVALMPILRAAVAEAGCPALLVSHDAFEVQSLAARVLWLAKGEIVGREGYPDGSGGVAHPLLGRVIGPGAAQGFVQVAVGDLILDVRGTPPADSEVRVIVPGRSILLGLAEPRESTAAGSIAAQITDIHQPKGARRTRVTVELGAEQSLTAVVPHERAGALDIAVGRQVTATILEARILAD